MIWALMTTSLDFGYPWWLSYGHLVLAGGTGSLLLLGFFRRWSLWLLIPLAAITLWAASVFPLIRFGVNLNSAPALPTESFLKTGGGKVLDLGAGTGRSSIMVLAARPNTTLVALDLFGESFDQHFGHRETPQQQLMANLKAAGVDQRVSVVTADMRKIPYPDTSFDAVISSYAVDHLRRDGVKQTLAEVFRVLKPGGEFLMVIVNGRDPWLRYAFPMVAAHGGFRGTDWWKATVAESGLHVDEDGMVPASYYILADRPGGTPGGPISNNVVR
jgi:SAM-dependent methyltransferase